MSKIKQKISVWKLDLLASCLLSLTLIYGFNKIENYNQQAGFTSVNRSAIMPNIKFGFDLNQFSFESYKIKSGDVISEVFSDHGINSEILEMISQKSEDIFAFEKFKAGRNYHILKPDSCSKMCALVYEPSPMHYVVYDLRNQEVKVSIHEKQLQTCVDYTEGEIESSLWSALEDKGVSPAIIDKMEDALASSVDFYHTQKGDKFKLIFEKKYADGEEMGLGKLLGAVYINENGAHYAVHYENGEYSGYYDYQGRAAKAAFLKSPVKFTRISSGFNMRRFHPIRRRTVPHLGTDYAAPYGTPIRAVGDGVIEEVAYTGNNGKYVKIKHDKTYQTQYLHMQGFASGMKRGRRVQQGETIGYVGATGLATGPHVCFRFWKNGVQVNHLKQKFEPTKPLPTSEMPKFFEKRDEIKHILDNMNSPVSKSRQA